QKRKMHIHAGEMLSVELDEIEGSGEPTNKQFQMLADVIDDKIHQNYKLWPSKYIAYDLLNNTDRFKEKYTEKEKSQFERRIERRSDKQYIVALHHLLAI